MKEILEGLSPSSKLETLMGFKGKLSLGEETAVIKVLQAHLETPSCRETGSSKEVTLENFNMLISDDEKGSENDP